MPDKNSSDYSTTGPLNTAMRCGIFTNARGEILIIHDQEVKEPIQWIEYQKHLNKIFLIHKDGTSQNLGLPIDKKMQGNMLHGIDVTLAYIKNKRVISSQKVSLVIQDY